ncbi:Acetyl-CoA acetyltransferase [Candidatus Magnetomoraceae bacterium gMMP-15]
MQNVVIVSGARTPIGIFGGSLKSINAANLGAIVIKEVIKKINMRPVPSELMMDIAPDKLKNQGMTDLEKKYYDWDPSAAPIAIDEVIMGNVLLAGQGQNPARQAMIYAGIPKETDAYVINMVCGSGLKAIAMAVTTIMAGSADIIIAGGQENMSSVPFALPKARWGHRMEITGRGDVLDLMVVDGLHECFYDYHMGMSAENIAKIYNLTRKDQDELAVMSHQKARKAIADGFFKDEIIPVTVKTRKGDVIFDTDERPMDVNMEKMAKFRPAFKKGGTVTAANASGINDGASAVLLMTEEKAKELGLKPMVRIKDIASAGVDPACMGLGPVPSVRKLMKTTGMTLDDIDTIELNEAFAAQALACMQELKIDIEKPNELGSGISLGHPIGCTGARQTVTAIHNMKRNGYNTGLVTMCVGGGMGMAMCLEQM